MPPLMFDTSIYIGALRFAVEPLLELERLARGAPVWLSAVVLAELYAGASARDRHHVDELDRTFRRTTRILVPSATDWAEAGKLLSRIAAKYGYEKIGKGRLINDTLIATTAARTGTTVVTSNARDFSKLNEFRSFLWRLSSTGA